MELKKLIFSELRNLRFKQGYIWRFQQYNMFRIELNPIEQNEFISTMNELCQQEVFLREQDYIIDNAVIYRYRLTDKGEQLIWSE